MNPLLESFLKQGLLFDAVGVIGLGLIALAATKLAFRNHSWGGSMMALGAVALLMTRLYVIIAPRVITLDLLCDIGPLGNSLLIGLPPLFLSFGLAGVVWGLWGHERWLNEEGH